MNPNTMTVRFWGVCGSIPAPISPQTIETLRTSTTVETPKLPAYYGGNTACVTIEAGGEMIILDMGSGLRVFGRSILGQVMKEKKFRAHVFMSHVHWDHIQGFPFFGPVYLPRAVFDVKMNLWGGVDWQEPLDAVLAGQMSHPKFPITMKQISLESAQLAYETVHHRKIVKIATPQGEIEVECGRLNHPNETYGYRIAFRHLTVVFTTDNEGYSSPDQSLCHLASGADLWITDCQYTNAQYSGEGGGMAHTGWGHSCPKHVIAAALAAAKPPKRIVTFHHDPDNSAETIRDIAKEIETKAVICTTPALEGETIVFADD
jgi:phosphoribosyl 1,2-cyclic phosphodiesterase